MAVDKEREGTYTYYAVISLPDYPAEKPLGLFRAPNGNVTELEVLRRDAAEDAGGKEILIRIRERFGVRVADIVEHCSDTIEADKPPWQPRKEAYLASLATINDPSILLVSIADKLHNAKSILKDYKTCGNKVWTRFNATERQIIWYYQSLLSIYQNKSHLCPGHLVEELQQTIKELASHLK